MFENFNLCSWQSCSKHKWGMIQFIANNQTFSIDQSWQVGWVGSKAHTKHHGRLFTNKPCYKSLKLHVYIKRAKFMSCTTRSKSVVSYSLLWIICTGSRMLGKAKIVIRAKIKSSDSFPCVSATKRWNLLNIPQILLAWYKMWITGVDLVRLCRPRLDELSIYSFGQCNSVFRARRRSRPHIIKI